LIFTNGILPVSHQLNRVRLDTGKRVRISFSLMNVESVFVMVLLSLLFMFDRKFDRMPNKSPEPTAVGAVSSAIAVHVASRRWLSFFR
jgi:hypothetical protein